MTELELKIIHILEAEMDSNSDASHDISHLKRVARNCLKIQKEEGGNTEILLLSSYFHDIVSFPKNSPVRHLSSEFSAKKTLHILETHFKDIPDRYYQPIAEAIRSHSYSANITPTSLEGRILQDADRLDALGAVGLARVFYIAGRLNQKLFDDNDPFATHRQLNDKEYALDHFYQKLFKLHDTFKTCTGKKIATERVDALNVFIENLKNEIVIN